jgi:hypothetical protein
MPRFTVVLEVRRRGSSCGTTSDTFEAADAAEAEQLAIEAWTAARQGLPFHRCSPSRSPRRPD